MEHEEVKQKVSDYFEDNGYKVLKEFELDCRGDKPKLDIVAFRWESGCNIETVAVECKGKRDVGKLKLLDSIISQIREYQAGFPKVYLAIPEDKRDSVPEDMLEAYGIGLLLVSKNGLKEESKPNIDKTAPKLDPEIYGYSVRQKLVSYMAFGEVRTFEDISLNHYNNFGFACWTNEFCNFCISNQDFLARDYYLILVLEKKENVKILSYLETDELYNELKKLPQEFSIIIYETPSYVRMRSEMPIAKKTINDLERGFLEWLAGYMKRRNWKFSLVVGNRVWKIDEFLTRGEHEERLMEVKEHLEKLRSYLVSKTKSK